jgi:hypothetical protein
MDYFQPSPCPGRLAGEKKMHTGKSTRSRGGQPANTNALKHGFYSKKFDKLELSDLEAITSNNLDDEIELLRVINRRVFDYANKKKQDLDTWVTLLIVQGKAATQLANLLRTQKFL